MQSREEFPCAAASKLNDAAVFEVMPPAKSGPLWSKTVSWLRKFFTFARDLSAQAGKHYYTDTQLVASNNMCRHFLTHVCNEDKGRSRPRSARAALSAYRQRVGFSSLTCDSAISDLVRGYEAARPVTKRQAAGLTEFMLRFISKKWVPACPGGNDSAR